MDLSKSHLLSLLLSAIIFSLAIASPQYSYDDYVKHHPKSKVSEFGFINRRSLTDCVDPNPYLSITTSVSSTLPNETYVTVTAGGVLAPDSSDWIGMISPSNSSVDACNSAANYVQTGDVSSLPLLCHYPVKAQYLSKDPYYLNCSTQTCQKYTGSTCSQYTCSGSIEFHVINIRTDIEFVFFTGGFSTPCVLKRTNPIKFTNPSAPLYGHLSSVDSTGTSMRLTWVSGSGTSQQVQYSSGQSSTSTVKTFTTSDMCSSSGTPSPAKDFGWHDPGYIHSAVMTGLLPSTTYTYRYGSASVGWSSTLSFKTPPASGASNILTFVVYGDMGKAPLDQSVEHYIQPGSTSVATAISNDIDTHNIDSVFHIGDISYATGFLVEWEFFLKQIEPYASRVPYMTAIGNHERDYPGSGSVYTLTDSGGECGVPYETYFQMPTSASDKPWYSIEQGPVHFTVISTEHTWTSGSEQYNWTDADLASVNRQTTPWIVFAGHREMYSSADTPDSSFVDSIEPLLLKYKVDLVLFGHVHNYERTCAVYQQQCLGTPTKDANGIDTYNNNNYSAPVQVVVGMAGFSLDSSASNASSWSLVRLSEYGFARVTATKTNLLFEFVNSTTTQVRDRFQIVRS